MKRNSSRLAVNLILLAAAAIGPRFLGPYDLRILTLAAFNAILALSVNFTLGYVGQPNFGQALMYGLGGYTSAILSVRHGFPFILSLLSAGLVTALAGVVFGPIVLRLRGAYFCMVTIALAQAFMLIVQNLIGFTGGPMGLPGIPMGSLFGQGLNGYRFWLVAVAVLALTMYVTHRLENSVVGRAWVGIRDSETLARSIGVNTYFYAILSYIVGAFFAGLAGSLSAHYTTLVDPNVFAFSWSSLAVVAAVLGGSGTVWGPVVGALAITMLPEYLRLADMWRLPIFGLFLVVVVVLVPQGLFPAIVGWFRTKLGGGRKTASHVGMGD